MTMLRWKGIEVSGGALLLGALLYYFDDQGLFLLSMLACAIHELGHILAILALGGQVTRLRLTCVGAEMRLSARHAIGHMGQVLAALSGPLVNLAAGFLSVRLLGEKGWCFAGINLALGAFNLLPAGCLDGGRALRFMLGPLLGEDGAARSNRPQWRNARVIPVGPQNPHGTWRRRSATSGTRRSSSSLARTSSGESQGTRSAGSSARRHRVAGTE